MSERDLRVALSVVTAICLAAQAARAQPSASEPAPPTGPGASAADPGAPADAQPELTAPHTLYPPSRETDLGTPGAGAGEPGAADDASAAAGGDPRTAQAAGGPRIDMPPELPPPVPPDPNLPLIQFGSSADSSEAITRGLGPARMAQSTTVVGGYGQFNLNALRVGPASDNDFVTRANLRRIVLFVAHPITNAIRVYSEFEWENAIACGTCNGSAEVEQAFLDWNLFGQAITLRAGLLLVPMGIVNQWHEPPVFHGVDRPAVDTLVIPSTWRELGIGFNGRLSETWRYELYLTTTLDPLRLDPQGLSTALSLGSLARANAFAVTGRMEFEPLLGIITGLAFFASDLGGNGDYFRRNGKKRDLKLPLLGYAIDARARRFGLEARFLWSQFFLPNSGDLLESYREDGSPLFPNVDATGPIPERIQGGYLELAYNTLYWTRTTQELLAFVRLERYDTQAKVPEGYKAEPELSVEELTAGLTYRPLPQLVWKADVQLRDRRYGLDELQLNAGFGYMF